MSQAYDYTAADYRDAFLRCLPTGPIWPRDPDAVPSQVAGALFNCYAASGRAATALLVDAFPATADGLLPEWESTLGLPDPCAGPEPTLQQRRAQVVARLTDNGGASIPYLIAFARMLGFAITITQFAPARAGLFRAGQPAMGNAWAFTWQVNAGATTSTFFRAGASAAGEPLQAFGNAVLQCELERLAPAHTVVLFSYGGLPAIGPGSPRTDGPATSSPTGLAAR